MTKNQEAPVPYKLLPAQRNVKAGCWPVFLLVAMLACSITQGVRKFAEPIDTAGCKADCRIVGLYMSRYRYEDDTCWCALEGGGEIKAHEFVDFVEGE